MRTTLQPLVVPVDDRPRRSSRSRLAPYSPQKVGRHPAHWNGVAWVPWAKPVRPSSRGSRLATTVTLVGLALIAITLLTPGFGFALVQWIAIFLAVVGIVAYLRHQFVRDGERNPAR